MKNRENKIVKEKGFRQITWASYVWVGSGSGASPVAFQNPQEGLLELLIGHRIAEWIDRRVQVAKEIGESIEVHEENGVVARLTIRRDHTDYMVGSPAKHERAENECDCAQGFSRSILILRLGL